MRCDNCGYDVEKGLYFCPFCGTDVSEKIEKECLITEINQDCKNKSNGEQYCESNEVQLETIESENCKRSTTNNTEPITQIFQFSNIAEEKLYIINTIKEWMNQSASINIGVLGLTRNQIDIYSEWLTDAKIPFELITVETVKNDCDATNKTGVKLVNICEVNGLEFHHVIIPQFEEGVFQKSSEHRALDERQNEMITMRNLAYVTMTKAAYSLVFTYVTKHSEFNLNCNKKEKDAVIEKEDISTSKVSSNVTKKNDSEKTKNKTKKNTTNTLKSYFQSKGLEVIDKRSNGGCLWVVGDEKNIGKYVNEAKRLFSAVGRYGSGRATKHRMGWYTKCGK